MTDEEITFDNVQGDKPPKTRQQRWRSENPDRYRAHLRVASAVRKGTLVKLPCKVCGNPRTDAHHPDYRRPLRVIWLCRFHHVAEHRADRKGKV